MYQRHNSILTSTVAWLFIGALIFAPMRAVRGQDSEPSEETISSLDTRLTREYGVRYPLVCAGMAFVGTAPLAAAA